jgi:hypothetical protein
MFRRVLFTRTSRHAIVFVLTDPTSMPVPKLCIFLGLTLCFVAVFSTRLGVNFYAGRSRRIKMPAWQGRAWFLICGGLLIVDGISGAPGTPKSALLSHLNKALLVSQNLFELFGGLIFVAAGAVYLLATRENDDMPAWQTNFWGAFMVFIGLNMILDVAWNLRS